MVSNFQSFVKKNSSNKKLDISKFLGCFAYWNQNCQSWNGDLKLVQCEIMFENFQVFGLFCILGLQPEVMELILRIGSI